MPSLREVVAEGEKRNAVIEDACRVLDAEVGDKGGLGGVAIKAAYKMVKGLKPGFVRQAVDHLLDDFLGALDPFYQEALAQGVKPSQRLLADRERVAEALLSVTDARARAKGEGGALEKTYQKLRPSAHKHVEAAAPRLAEMLDRHVPAS